MNDHDQITQAKELAQYKLEKLGVNIEKIEEVGAVQPRNWIQMEQREKLDAERAVKRKMEEEKEEEDQKQRQAKRQKTIATVGGKRRLSFENVSKENEEQDELTKDLDFFAKRAEQQNEIIRNHEEMLTKADDELARKERKMQLIEEELQKKERKIKELEECLQKKSVEGEIVEQPKIQQPVASSSSASDSVYPLENILKPENQIFLSKPQKSVCSTVPGTQFALSSVSNVNPTYQQVTTVPITEVTTVPVTTVPVTQEYYQMPSNVPSVVSVIQPMQPEVYIDNPDNTNVEQVILVKKNVEKITEKRSGRTRPVTGVLQDSTRKYCDSCKASFSQSDVLAIHKKYDCGKTIIQFVCEKCHKGFYSEVSVREHYYKEHLKTFLYFARNAILGFIKTAGSRIIRKVEKCPQKDSPNQFPPRASLNKTLELTFKRREIVQIPKGLVQDSSDNPIAPTSDLPEVIETSQSGVPSGEVPSGEKSVTQEQPEKESNEEVPDSNIPSIETGKAIEDSTKIDITDMSLLTASGSMITPESFLANTSSEIGTSGNPISIKPEYKEDKQDIIEIDMDK